jgi:hypothetical protein
VSPLSIRPFCIEGVVEGEVEEPIPDVPLDSAVPLSMPDFEVSLEEELELGFATLLDPAAVPEPAPTGEDCANAARSGDQNLFHYRTPFERRCNNGKQIMFPAVFWKEVGARKIKPRFYSRK